MSIFLCRISHLKVGHYRRVIEQHVPINGFSLEKLGVFRLRNPGCPKS